MNTDNRRYKNSAFLLGAHRYKASVEHIAPGGACLDRHRRCFLGVSLGNPNFDGARLEACVQWISEHFRECAIAIADSTYRLTLQVRRGLPPVEARTLALQAGQEFMARIQPLLTFYQSQCRFEFLPDSALELSPDYPRYLAMMEDLYRLYPPFRATVLEFSRKYLGQTDGQAGPAEAAWLNEQLAARYLLEESAIFAMLVRAGWKVLVYPGAIKAFEDIAEGRLPDVPDELKELVLVALRLKRVGAYFADEATKLLWAFPHQLPEPADVPHLDTVLRYTQERPFREREAIVEHGQTDRSLFILGDGRVAVTVPCEGARLEINTLGPNAIFGEQAFLDGQPRSATVFGKAAGRVNVLSPESFQELRSDHPSLACDLLLHVGRVQSARRRMYSAESILAQTEAAGL